MKISSSSVIVCMCEGGAENAIMELLLENDLLIFSESQLYEGKIYRRYGIKEFERRFLRKEFDEPVTVVRLIDSRNENFKVSKAYELQVKEVITITTAPEIEILIIIALGKYKEYTKYSSKKKPSIYCKEELDLSDVKKKVFVKKFFSDVSFLVSTIKEYERVHKKKPGELLLSDLLK